MGWVDPFGLAGGKGNKGESLAAQDKRPTKANDHNQAAFAEKWQGNKYYPGKDVWKNTTLKKDEIIYGGVPGQSAFYFDQATLQAANGSKEALWKSLQVLPHEKHGYRMTVQAYRVKRDSTAGVAKALAQDAVRYGKDGGTQYFMSNYKTVLEPVGVPFVLGP